MRYGKAMVMSFVTDAAGRRTWAFLDQRTCPEAASIRTAAGASGAKSVLGVGSALGGLASERTPVSGEAVAVTVADTDERVADVAARLGALLPKMSPMATSTEHRRRMAVPPIGAGQGIDKILPVSPDGMARVRLACAERLRDPTIER